MSYKLDKKDRRILYQLDLNSRQTNNQIAKKVGLSREVVQYRIKQLEKKQIIKGYQTLIDITKLGYLNCRFFIKLQRDSPKQKKALVEYYKEHPKFWWVNTIDGFKDLGIACWVKNMYEFFELKEDLMKKFGIIINELTMEVYSKFHIYKREYLLNEKTRVHPEITIFSPNKETLDNKDLDILRLLTPNARISSVEISAKTGISITNVNYRIKKLIEKKVIVDFRLILGLDKIGYYWYKVEMQLENFDAKKSLLEYFRNHPNIIYGYEAISKNDLEFEVEVASTEELRIIMDDIRRLFSKDIKQMNHFLWYKEHKFLFMP